VAEELLLDPYELRPVVRMWQVHPGFPNGVVGPRTLTDHELVLILQSAGAFVNAEGRRPLLAGELYYIRPGYEHTFYWGRRGTSHVPLHFDFDPAHRPPAGPVRLAGARPFPNVMRVGLRSPVAKVMLNVAEATRAHGSWHRLRWRAGLIELLAALAAGPLSLPTHHEPGSARESVDEARVRVALALLEERLSDPLLTTGQLAEAARLSEPHFRRRCREVTGWSPVELLQRRRLRKARELLLDARLQISEVARASGFGDPRYFARLFRKAEGLTPQEYRASVLMGEV